MNREILHGDVLEKIKEIPTASIDCIITSPPYWNLRSYGTGKWVDAKFECQHDSIKKEKNEFDDVQQYTAKICPECDAHYEDKQIGSESDFMLFLDIMDEIMEECKRILKDTGTCWINLGDTYNGDKKGNKDKKYSDDMRNGQNIDRKPESTVELKSRLGIPERFYIRCIDNGWVARNHIPWVKANNMPSSVKDRFTNKWESIFFFAKAQKYYFDLDAVREKPLTESKPFNVRVRETKKGHEQAKLTGGMSLEEDESYDSRGVRIKEKYTDPKSNVSRLHKDREGNPNKQDTTLGADGKPKPTYVGFNARYKASQYGTAHRKSAAVVSPSGGVHNLNIKNSHGFNILTGESANHVGGKNPGDVFFINPRPFPEAHHATFPIELPLKILKSSCPKEVCTECGVPRFPISKPTEEYAKMLQGSWHDHKNDAESGNNKHIENNITSQYEVVGYTECDCGKPFTSGVVLDPFFGAGTTGVAAEKLGLHWMGIELNEEYIKIARKRLDPYKNNSLGEYL